MPISMALQEAAASEASPTDLPVGEEGKRRWKGTKVGKGDGEKKKKKK